MECPKCGNKVKELDETCPKCGLVFDEYQESEQEDNEEKSKTALLKSINII